MSRLFEIQKGDIIVGAEERNGRGLYYVAEQHIHIYVYIISHVYCSFTYWCSFPPPAPSRLPSKRMWWVGRCYAAPQRGTERLKKDP
jgi:hypothetical protein